MNYVVADGRSNWMEGLILICAFFHFALTRRRLMVIVRFLRDHSHFILVLSWWVAFTLFRAKPLIYDPSE